MHVAATNPVALDLASVDPEVLAREKAILAEKNAGKPANVLEKITESGLKSYAKEYCLLEQAISMTARSRSARCSRRSRARSAPRSR
jgi:elongation factor Ts